ncbi:helix-turn-helix domain-containing protein [Streptomyces sp. CA-181903]|uniref:helix-turn-helix domain-containing protein n=1 Tax=Streptomyces sp. CA-181903 TaxID=3240055 RepID=UPI003D9423B8
MPAGGRPTVRSRRLGATLRRYREAAKLDQEHAAEKIAGSKSKVSRIEAGQVTAKPGDVRLMLELYGVTDPVVREHLERLARVSNRRGWWMDHRLPDQFTDLVTLEGDASYIRTWQPLFIPGLLQTPDYVRTLTRHSSLNVYTAEAEEAFLKVKEERRRAIGEKGAHFAAVIWEPALTAPMPSAEVHREQLCHIAEMAQQPNVTVQVLPVSEWKAAHMASHFVVYSFGPEPAPEAVAFDTPTNTVILEEPDDVAKHVRIFEALRSSALAPDQSVEFLRTVMKDIPEGGEAE